MAKKSKAAEVIANFWGCHRIGRIRIGTYDRCGIFTEIDSVKVAGAEYSDEEAAQARVIAAQLQAA